MYIVVTINFTDFGQSLGLPDLSELTDVLNFNMNDISLKTVFDSLDNSTKNKITSSMNKVLKNIFEVRHLS